MAHDKSAVRGGTKPVDSLGRSGIPLRCIGAVSMLARLLQATAITLTLLALGWAIVHAWRGQFLVALAGALLILFAHAVVIAFELLLALRVNWNESTPAPSARALFGAWWGEVRCAAGAFFWNQPFRSHAVPDSLTDRTTATTGIVLVHGFLCNRGLWNPWLRRFRALDVAYVAVNLEPAFGGIERYCTVIGDAVRRVEAATGARPVVVAHSMGGLAVRAWLAQNHSPQGVRHVITWLTTITLAG